jgi:hypothetical protein
MGEVEEGAGEEIVMDMNLEAVFKEMKTNMKQEKLQE